MRWERLFDDLEAQAAAEADLELAAEVADRTRRERAVLGLHERLAGMRRVGAISAEVAGLGAVRTVVADVGAVVADFDGLVTQESWTPTTMFDPALAQQMAEHPIDLPRRPEHVGDVRTIPFAWIGAVLRV